ncbi:hypothetical protein HD554DRAFT_890428 [Boletus coccyginus]|nr:hypothetical protein HD554DRAFT_890428 [Boletus coccyginus]
MATRMHELGEGCRKADSSLRLCFAFSHANAVVPSTHVLATRIHPGLVQRRCLSDHAYLMLCGRSVMVCTLGGRIRVVYRVSDKRSGTWLSFSSRHTTEWRISRGPQDIHFDVVSAGRAARCRREARGEGGRGCLAKLVWEGSQELDAETEKKKDGGMVCIRPLAYDPKEGFSGTSEKQISDCIVGSRERRQPRHQVALVVAQKFWGSPLKLGSIGRVSARFLVAPPPDSHSITVDSSRDACIFSSPRARARRTCGSFGIDREG